MRLTLVLCFVASVASGQTVTGVNGTLTQGSTITITGSSFGTGQAPLKFDDFQSVTIGQPITGSSAAGPAWTNGADEARNRVIASSTRVRPNTPFDRSMRSHWDASSWDPGGDSSTSSVVLLAQSLPPSTKFFIDYYQYFDTSAASGALTGAFNAKNWRFHADDNGGAPNVNMVYLGNEVVVAGDGGIPDDGVSDYWDSHGDAINISGSIANAWAHWQFAWDLGTGGVNDASVWARVVGPVQRAYSSTGMNFGTSTWHGVQNLYFGNYVNQNEPWTGVITSYWDSLYLSLTWARVEIGNNATYANATHREILTPITWAGTSITATLRRGSFGTSDSVYLYVCNAANTCSAGYNITLGGVGSATGPVRLRPIMLLAALIPFWSLYRRAA